MAQDGQACAGAPRVALLVLGVFTGAGKPTGQEQQSDDRQQPPSGQYDQGDPAVTGDQGNYLPKQGDDADDGVQPQQGG